MIYAKKIFRVTGLSQFDYARFKDGIKPGCVLTLRPQPTNKYDTNAIGVYFTDTNPIGWIPKQDNPPLAELLNYCNISRHQVLVTRAEVKNPIYESVVEIQVKVKLLDYTSQTTLENLTKQGFSFIDEREQLHTGFEAYCRLNPSAKSAVSSNPCKEISTTGHAVDAITYATTANSSIRNTGIISNNIQLDGNITLSNSARASLKQQLNKDNKMAKILDTNKQVATQAAYMEAGRIFLNQITKVVAKQAPLMVKGYVDTPAGKLVLANATLMAVQHFRGQDARLNKLANAALTQAYQDMYKAFDIEKFIEGFLDNDSIRTALNSVGGTDD